MAPSVELYNHAYGEYASAAETAVRQETYDQDIGQTSWITAAEWLHFADELGVRQDSEVLEVGSGSGGPAVYLAQSRRCRIVGVDINEHGIRNANQLATAREVAGRVQFRAVDASQPLPFAAAAFDAVVSNDAMCHIANRLQVLRDWYRVLRPTGRMLFTDPLVLTGAISQEEVATRTSIGFYLIVPSGENERLIDEAGFTLLGVEDVTAGPASIAQRRHDAREKHRSDLIAREGEANFAGLQRFLACVSLLARERRLSRFAYLAQRRS
jgi:SAM-dependent methyltransferase